MKEQLIKNRKNVFQFLANNAMAIFHSGYEQFKTADASYPFFVNHNFYYLTGINQADVTLVIAKLNNKYVERLFIQENDLELSKWVGSSISIEAASDLSGIALENIVYNPSFASYIQNHLQPLRYSFEVIEAVYLDLEQRDYPFYQTFGLSFSKKLKEDYPAIKINNIYPKLISLRMIKNQDEVQLIKQSISTTKRAIENVMKNANHLTNEAEALAYHNFVLTCENKMPSFESIIASGKNATILHYVDNNSAFAPNSLLLMDVGCYTFNYASDITRTIPLTGKFTKRQKEVYEVVLDVNKKCIAYLKAGITWQELNQYAQDLLLAGCKQLGLLSDKSDLTKYYYHSIGHSLGLDVHDPSMASQGIVAGMVITIEPGLYLEEEGIGIRIEDNILILEKEVINLSKDIIKEVKDIEAFMKK